MTNDWRHVLGWVRLLILAIVSPVRPVSVYRDPGTTPQSIAGAGSDGRTGRQGTTGRSGP